jgi:hypothetical protein
MSRERQRRVVRQKPSSRYVTWGFVCGLGDFSVLLDHSAEDSVSADLVCRVPELGCGRWPAVLGCAFIFVDQASKDRSVSDPLLVKVRGGMVGAWREKSLRPVWSPAV